MRNGAEPWRKRAMLPQAAASFSIPPWVAPDVIARSEEHTSELQSQSNLVCRLLLEKKKKLWRTMRKFDLSLRHSRSSYFATFRHQLMSLSIPAALYSAQLLHTLVPFV